MLSQKRKQLHQLIDRIGQLANKSLHGDPLIKGSPVTVYRTCGKAGCACMTDASKRHGPYRVVQIYRNGKQKQVSLKKHDIETWNKVLHYQQQIKYFNQLKKQLLELETVVNEVIDSRLEEIS